MHRNKLQSFKNTILSKNLDQDTLKNALFFVKRWKNLCRVILFVKGSFVYLLLFATVAYSTHGIIVCKPCMLFMQNW